MSKPIRLAGVIRESIVDGPGIRYVVFFQGCPLRCIFCHNPDSWAFGSGTRMEVEELVSKIVALRPFYRKGGVTLSGNMLKYGSEGAKAYYETYVIKPEFAAALLRRLKEEGFHTAVDTAGAIPLERCREAVDRADLLLLDIKALDPALCRTLTGSDGAGAKALLDYRQAQGRFRQAAQAAETLYGPDHWECRVAREHMEMARRAAEAAQQRKGG